MKRLLTGIATASLLIGVPLAAAAHDRDDHRRGWERHGHHDDWQRPAQVYHYYRPVPPVVYYPYYPAPRVVYRPVYVPAPVPAPYPPVDSPRVSIGFRVLF